MKRATQMGRGIEFMKTDGTEGACIGKSKI